MLLHYLTWFVILNPNKPIQKCLTHGVAHTLCITPFPLTTAFPALTLVFRHVLFAFSSLWVVGRLFLLKGNPLFWLYLPRINASYSILEVLVSQGHFCVARLPMSFFRLHVLRLPGIQTMQKYGSRERKQMQDVKMWMLGNRTFWSV